MLVKLGALEALIEAAMDPATAGALGVAIIVTHIGDNVNVVAYDVAGLLERALQGVDDGDDPIDSIEKNGTGAIVGIVSMRPTDPSSEGNCYGSYVIQAAAARKGYGPLIYDLALSLGKPVVPDRRAVSAPARKVWDKYASRGDVKKLPLDDRDDPQTPDKEDDCVTFKDAPGLNYAFSKPDNGRYSTMQNNSSQALRAYNERLKQAGLRPINGSSWEEAVTPAAADYFTIRYASDVIHSP